MSGQEVRRLLARSYTAFFGRFRALRPVQVRGIPEVLAGRDVLLCAPTAGGKTEAYAAPIAERLAARPEGRRPPFYAVIVVPTRALANDLHLRLAPAFDQVGVTFGRYTGEHKDRSEGRPPSVAVVTPEALDALLARRPAVLQDLAVLVLDELHALDGTARGDQLRVLLHRADLAAGRAVQRVAASATVPDPAGLVARTLRGRALVVDVERALRARAWPIRPAGDLVATLRQALHDLAGDGVKKVLVFVRGRARVDRVAHDLRGRTPWGPRVYPHHGSLSQQVREQTERLAREQPTAVIVSTTTLELGIDIGTVDYVVIADRPPSVQSLLQRVGRGGRRGGVRRFGFVVEDAGDRVVYEAMLRHAARGELLADPYAFRPSVLVQQALVLAAGQGRVDAASLAAALPPDLRPPAAELEELLAAAAERELLEAVGRGVYVLGERGERQYESGNAHANIGEPVARELVDQASGAVVAAASREEQFEPGQYLDIGGEVWEVLRADETEGVKLRALDRRRGGRRASRTVRYPPTTRPHVGFRLARAVAARLGARPDEVLLARAATGEWLLLHGLGTIGARWLASLLEARGRRVRPARAGWRPPVVFEVAPPRGADSGAPPVDLDALRPEPGHARAWLAARNTAEEVVVARRIAMGPYHRHLPVEQRVRATLAASTLDAIEEWLRACSLRVLDEPAPSEWMALAARFD